MGEIIVRKVRGMNWKAKISLVLIFTLVFSTFMYQGWYKPKPAQAAISELQAWSNVYHGTSTTQQNIAYTVPSGSNAYRVLVVAIATSRTTVGSRSVTLTYGGQTLTPINGNMAVTTIQQHSGLYYLDEAGLDAASNTTLAVTVGTGTTRITDVFAAVYDNVDQTTPITNSQTYDSGTTQSAGPHSFGTPLTVNTNDQAVEIVSAMRVGSTTARTITYAANWTMQQQQTWTTTDAVRNAVATRSVPATDTTDVSSTSFSGTALATMTAISLRAVCIDSTPSTITISPSQTANGNTYDASAMKTSTGNVGTFEYRVTGPGATPTTDTYTTSTTWTAPAGVTSVDVEAWGAGGGGGGQGTLTSDGGGGGGGGAYSKKISIPVTPGNNYTVTVGTGGTAGSGGAGCGGTGGDSWFSTNGTVMAKGGVGGCASTGTPPAGGLGGDAASGVGDTKYSGGQGEAGNNGSTGQGGYGGSSAGSAADGWSGPQTWITITYPTASTPAGGGHGGNGGANTANGSAPASGNGGGGGGSGSDGATNRVGGVGAAGKVMITYRPMVTCTDWQSSASIPATAAGGSLCGDYTNGGTYTLDVRGTDPDCGTAVTTTPTNFTWTSCSETATVALDAVPNPITGATAITATLGGSGGSSPQVQWRTDGGAWSGWQASGATYTPPAGATGTADFQAQATGSCGGTIADPANPTATTYNTTCVASQVTGLAAGAATTGSIPLTWTSPTTNVNYYNVYRDGVKISTDGAVTTGSFTDNGPLTPSKTYSYYIKGYNTGAACEGAASSTVNKSTLAVTPGAPTVQTVDATTLSVAVGSDTNSAEATYAIRINGGAYTNQYINASGGVQGTAVWQTKAAWGTRTVPGLATGTTYTFDVKARNGNSELIETVFGATAAMAPHVVQPSTITTCAGCHGFGATFTDGTARNNPAGTFRGSHNKHVVTYGKVCSVCHTVPATEDSNSYAHRNSTIEMASPINGNTGAAYTKGTSWPQTNNPSAFTGCTNTYCHSNGTSVSTGTIPANTSTAWAGSTTCASCHGSPPAYANNSPKKNSHSAGGHSITCDRCHYVTTTDGSTIASASSHANSTYNVNPNSGAGVSFTYTYNAGGGSCATVSCHGTAQWGVTVMNCTTCHAAAVGNRRQVTGAGGDFIRLSRHVSNGTATEIVTVWDCVLCHLEGNPADGKTTANHTGVVNGNADINLRNVDNYGTGYVWNKSGTITTTMRDNMDTFCMNCHDSNGASQIAVNNSNNGMLLNDTTTVRTVTGAGNANPNSVTVNLRPFNTNDQLRHGRNDNIALTGNYATLRTSTYGRVLNVKDQFNSTNQVGKNWASHHNLNQFTKRYSTRNTTTWPAAAWTAYVTKEGVAINSATGAELAGLHCSDCHLNETNSHGSANAWYMLQSKTTTAQAPGSESDTAPTTTGVANTANQLMCFRCHAAGTYAADSTTGTTNSSNDHGNDCAGSRVSETRSAYPFGIQCAACHGGFSTATSGALGSIHGTNETYDPGAAGGTTSKRYRFMSGGSMRFYLPNATYSAETNWENTTAGSCYTISTADTWGGCVEHNGEPAYTRKGRKLTY